MKKIVLFMLFALPILRGQLTAQVCDSTLFYSFEYRPVCNGNSTLKINYNSSRATYTFRLNGVASATNTWQNVAPGNYTIGYTGSNGCNQADRAGLTLSPATLTTFLQEQPRTNCLDTLRSFKIIVGGGQPPYTFNINNGPTTTNDIVALPVGSHSIQVADATGCNNLTLPYATYRIDSVQTRYTFVPNSPCDSVGTLTLSFPNSTLQRPFSISLGGRPFTTDSVFTNVVLRSANSFKVRTPLGCVYSGLFRYSSPVARLTYNINYNSCGAPALLGITPLNAGTTIYTFKLNGLAASANNTWQNIVPGRYYLSYSSNTGCNSGDSITVVGVPLRITTEQQPLQDCSSLTGLFKISVTGGRPPYTFSINNGAVTTNPVVSLPRGINYITVADSSGCRTANIYQYIEYRFDTVSTRYTFVPNNPCDSLGTLTIFVNNPNLRRPLSISLSGRPFVADTVLRNVSIYNYQSFVVKTADGCSYLSSIQEYSSVTQLNYRLNYNSCGAPTQLSITYNDSSGTRYTFSLDGVASATNTWQNVAPGNHRLSYTSSTGCTRSGINIVLSVGRLLNIYTYALQLPTISCTDSSRLYRIVANGGLPPYTFTINGGAATLDSVAFLRNGGNYISVSDRTGCRTDSIYRFITYRRDTVVAANTFTPNRACGDSIGTLRLSINDPRIARPFTISLEGGAFTSDTVFPNIINQYGSLHFIVKSAQGCLYEGRTDYYRATPIVLGIKDSVCANRLGKGIMVAYAIGSNGAPLPIRWNNGSTSRVLIDAPIGTYSIIVTDANGCTATASKTLTTCVWPGDTDTSGVVNAADLLNIGLAFGERGQSRDYCQYDSSSANTFCTHWQPNNFPFWSKQTATGVNLKHVDASGNGLINHNDTLAITRNWSRTRSLRGNTGNSLEVRGSAPKIYVQTSAVTEGRWTAFPIMLGDITNAATGVYGLYFSISYDPSVIDASSVYLSFGQNWLGNGDDVLRVFKTFDGAVEAAICRTNQQNTSGSGQIATLHFKTKAGTAGRRLPFDVSNQYAINRNAQSVPIVIEASSTTVLTSTVEPDWARQIEVYPNPTTDKVTVEGSNLTIQSIEVLDISGKSISKTQVVGNNTPLSIQNLGTYFLKIQTEKGVLMRKVVRL